MNILPKPTISILGSGAMGLLWSGYLSFEGLNVELITHKTGPFPANTLVKVSEITSPSADAKIETTPVYAEKFCSPIALSSSANQQTKSAHPFDILLVCVKAHQVVEAISAVIERVTGNTTLIFIQNGVGIDDELTKALPQIKQTQLIYAVTTHGAMILPLNESTKSRQTNDLCVAHTGLGATFFGQKSSAQGKPPQKLLPLLQSSLCDGWKQDIDVTIWRKLLINSVINPLTTLADCKNGDLLLPNLKPILLKLMEESVLIASESGYIFDPIEEYEQLKQVITKTAMNYSSMHQDIKYNRKTEIAYINGFLVKQANKLGVDCPINDLLTQLVIAKHPHNSVL